MHHRRHSEGITQEFENQCHKILQNEGTVLSGACSELVHTATLFSITEYHNFFFFFFLDVETEPLYTPVLKEYADNKCFEG